MAAVVSCLPRVVCISAIVRFGIGCSIVRSAWSPCSPCQWCHRCSLRLYLLCCCVPMSFVGGHGGSSFGAASYSSQPALRLSCCCIAAMKPRWCSGQMAAGVGLLPSQLHLALDVQCFQLFLICIAGGAAATRHLVWSRFRLNQTLRDDGPLLTSAAVLASLSCCWLGLVSTCGAGRYVTAGGLAPRGGWCGAAASSV